MIVPHRLNGWFVPYASQAATAMFARQLTFEDLLRRWLRSGDAPPLGMECSFRKVWWDAEARKIMTRVIPASEVFL